jgi:hypothetical protein
MSVPVALLNINYSSGKIRVFRAVMSTVMVLKTVFQAAVRNLLIGTSTINEICVWNVISSGLREKMAESIEPSHNQFRKGLNSR